MVVDFRVPWRPPDGAVSRKPRQRSERDARHLDYPAHHSSREKLVSLPERENSSCNIRAIVTGSARPIDHSASGSGRLRTAAATLCGGPQDTAARELEIRSSRPPGDDSVLARRGEPSLERNGRVARPALERPAECRFVREAQLVGKRRYVDHSPLEIAQRLFPASLL